MHMIRTLVLALLLGPAAALAAQEPTVVILVRHAERASPTGDAGLSPEGEARAAALAAALAGAHVDGIITTQLQRTRMTAAPLATQLGLTPTIVASTAGSHARAVADSVRAKYAGKTVLVVGHSNTIPPIIAALGGPSAPDLCDNQFSAIFTLVLRPGGTVTLVEGKYGEPDAPAPADCARTMRQGR